MRQASQVSEGQLDFFSSFDKSDTKCDRLLQNLIGEAQNMRFLVTRIKFSDTKDRVKKFWNFELEVLLDLQAELCASIAAHSNSHYHKTSSEFSKMWRRFDDANMAECPNTDELVSHHRNCNLRLKSAIMSQSTCLRDSGLIIDKILKQLDYHNKLFNSYYL